MYVIIVYYIIEILEQLLILEHDAKMTLAMSLDLSVQSV
jgi:hypothetical protein